MTIDRPILFSPPMILALLAGTKTQTRRILKSLIPDEPAMDAINPNHTAKHSRPYLDAYCSQSKTPTNPRGMSENWCWWTRDERPGHIFKVGYVPGHRLWVREAWRVASTFDDYPPRDFEADDDGSIEVFYEADYKKNPCDGRLRQSMFMPRWASRLTLLIESVRVERLQDISNEDAVAEGIPQDYLEHVHGPNGFRDIWKSINGPGSWKTNPWCIAIKFITINKNIDSCEATDV